MRHLLNTLYVMTQGAYLHLEGETLVVEIERQKRLQVPLHHLGSVVIFGDIMVSPAALHRCADDGRGVVLLDRRGQFKARLEGPLAETSCCGRRNTERRRLRRWNWRGPS